MKLALVDMDQTLCDYEGAVRAKLVELYGPLPTTVTLDGIYKPAVDLIKLVPGFWKKLPKIELGFQLVEALKSWGFSIHILSKGPYRTVSAWSEKVEWCREHLPGVPVTITEDKGLMYGKILVDDWPIYCEQWLQWRPRGLVLMPAYTYNEGFDTRFPDRVVRVTGHNWEMVGNAIRTLVQKIDGELT